MLQGNIVLQDYRSNSTERMNVLQLLSKRAISSIWIWRD